MKPSCFLPSALMRLALLWVAASVATVAGAASSDFKRVALPFLEKHCYECHGGKSTKGDLDLKQFKDDSKILQNRKIWLGVLQQVNAGEMPPKKYHARPNSTDVDRFDEVITRSLERAEAKAKPDPGRVVVRRLNRAEYNNTVRDLLQVDFNPAEDFPADDIGHGFDNIGDVLTISPVLMERYLDAAEAIAARAIVVDPPRPPSRTTSSIFLQPSGYRSENSKRPVDNAAHELFTKQRITVDGEYLFRIRAAATNAPGDKGLVTLAMLVDGRQLFTSVVTNRPGKWGTFDAALKLSAGEHRFAVKFTNPAKDGARMLFVQQLQVIGPSDTRPEFQKRLAALNPTQPKQVQEAVAWFLTRAFRRPPSKEETVRYTKLFQTAATAAGGRWESGAQELIKVALCSPKFLFRAELDDRPRERDAHPVDEFQLASRLSYFLWSSMPDDELLGLAARRKLTASLDTQVRRMLVDPRAETLVQNFALQWLQLRRLRTFAPDTGLFPGFNESLRTAMLRETELFIGEIIREDRSVLDLLTADFTWLNEPLARHYGIADTAGNWVGAKPKEKRPGGLPIRGEQFVRVSLPMPERGGLLTQASVLTVTSNPTRTSPVKRGKWVLEQILGTPPPPPPPGAPELDAQHELKGTLRQRMEQHRANPNCASCHANMDALGFALENYDAIGRFRSRDGEGVIDPSGTLPDGTRFNGPAELKSVLAGKQALVTQNLAEKLLTYALGRGLQYYDARAVRKITADLAQGGHRFSALVTAVVRSDPFRMRRGRDLEAQADDN